MIIIHVFISALARWPFSFLMWYLSLPLTPRGFVWLHWLRDTFPIFPMWFFGFSIAFDFAFRIVNFPYMDSNIPANPAYVVYISQLVRYARICTSKVDFINRLRGLSLRLRQLGFETNWLQNSFNKFVNRHGFIVEKYGAALREMRLAIQA